VGIRNGGPGPNGRQLVAADFAQSYVFRVESIRESANDEVAIGASSSSSELAQGNVRRSPTEWRSPRPRTFSFTSAGPRGRLHDAHRVRPGASQSLSDGPGRRLKSGSSGRCSSGRGDHAAMTKRPIRVIHQETDVIVLSFKVVASWVSNLAVPNAACVTPSVGRRGLVLSARGSPTRSSRRRPRPQTRTQ
jgi:hypothetical protein